jgi:hypothetical protein
MVDTVVDCLEAYQQSAHVVGLLRIARGLLSCCSASLDAELAAGFTPPTFDDDEDEDEDAEGEEGPGKQLGAGAGGKVPARGPSDTKARVRAWQGVVVRLVGACHPYLGSPGDGMRVCVAAFEVLRAGCGALAPFPRTLFPLLHTTWQWAMPCLRAPAAPALVPPSLLLGVHATPLATGPATGPPSGSAPYHATAAVSCLEWLGDVLALPGCASFLRTRFGEDVWPVTSAVLRHAVRPAHALTRSALQLVPAATSAVGGGPFQRASVGSGTGAGMSGGLGAGAAVLGAGAAVGPSEPPPPLEDERLVLAVLRCLQGVCDGTDTPALLRGLAWDAACLLLPLLSVHVPTGVREAAAGVYVSLSRAVDADVVWLVLRRASGAKETLGPPVGCPFLPPVAVGGEASLLWANHPSLHPRDIQRGVALTLGRLRGGSGGSGDGGGGGGASEGSGAGD